MCLTLRGGERRSRKARLLEPLTPNEQQNKVQAVEQHSQLNDEIAAGRLVPGDFVADTVVRHNQSGSNGYLWTTLIDWIDSVNARRQKWQKSLKVGKVSNGRQMGEITDEPAPEIQRPLQNVSRYAMPQHENTCDLQDPETVVTDKDYRDEGGKKIRGQNLGTAVITTKRGQNEGPSQQNLRHAKVDFELQYLEIAGSNNEGESAQSASKWNTTRVRRSNSASELITPATNPQANQRYPIAQHIEQSTFSLSPILIKTTSGIEAEHMLYDTGSSDNIISQELVDKYKLRRRPILPNDLKVYDTASEQTFTPRYYVEVEIKDKKYKIMKYTKVLFYVADSLGRNVKMLVGQNFLAQRGIRLVADTVIEGHGEAFISRGRPASESR